MTFKELKEKYEQFKAWQKRPYEVKPLSEEVHDCPTCGSHFKGNYCPRCGQSAKIGRYSFKKAFLLFLDVWGLGNRGMFRTVRDLILRPGYMIRDYLQGMQMAYFPPFKMMFLLVALELVVVTGLNIRLENRMEILQDQMVEILTENSYTDSAPADATITSQEAKPYDSVAMSVNLNNWMMKHMSITQIMMVLLFSGPLFLMMRKGPAYPDIKFSEFFVAMVYSSNMLNIVTIVSNFLCLNQIVDVFCYVLLIFPMKQLTGYSYWRTLLNIVVALIIFFLAVTIISGIINIVSYAFSVQS